MTGTLACDISEFQPPVDNTYPRQWLIFRGCDGSYIDPHAAHNLAWSINARQSGRLLGFTVYVVFRPGAQSAILANLDRLRVPTDCVIMIDAESWGGQIRGDHSTEINALADRLRARQDGRADLVWAYGNRGPDLSVWPRKPAWLGWVVASYGGEKPDVPNLAGWQYTDNHAYQVGLPTSTPPFGRCDHNIIYQLPEDDMPLSDADVQKVADAVWAKAFKSPLDGKTYSAASWLVYANVRASQVWGALKAANLGAIKNKILGTGGQS